MTNQHFTHDWHGDLFVGNYFHAVGVATIGVLRDMTDNGLKDALVGYYRFVVTAKSVIARKRGIRPESRKCEDSDGAEFFHR